jgi:hypothetical protein
MKVLIDECVDWRLSHDIVGHEVKTARQMGWTAIENGELLALAIRSDFDVFVTVDRNLSFQQNVGALAIAVVVLHTPPNRLVSGILFRNCWRSSIPLGPEQSQSLVNNS